MRTARYKLLLTCLAAMLVVAVLGQAVAQEAEAVFKVCAGEHQDGGQDDGSHCPCVCHHHDAATVEWRQAPMPSPLGTDSDAVENPQAIAEAPPVSIEYPPQLA